MFPSSVGAFKNLVLLGAGKMGLPFTAPVRAHAGYKGLIMA